MPLRGAHAAVLGLLLLSYVAASEPKPKGDEAARSATESRPPTDKSEFPDLSRPAPRNPRVLFITMKGCRACERELARLTRPGGDFEAMRARGWKIGPGAENHIQVVDRTAVPDLVRQLNVREFPTVA